MKAKVIVSCGPSFEPIDHVRRITNFSTGELGVRLSEALARKGFQVLCFKGSGASWPNPNAAWRVDQFDTNDDLLRLPRRSAAEHGVSAVFHVAALCDYKVTSIADERGNTWYGWLSPGPTNSTPRDHAFPKTIQSGHIESSREQLSATFPYADERTPNWIPNTY